MLSFFVCFFFFLHLLALDFLWTHSSILLLQNLGYVPLNKDELITKAATVYEQWLLFKRANVHSSVHKDTVCL